MSMNYLNYNEPIVPGGNFLWGEYCKLQMWDVLLIPDKTQHDKAVFLFTQIQKLIRGPLNKGLDIASGARNAKYTAYLKSIGIPAATGSAHNSWEAVDLEPPHGMTNAEFWKFCDKVWPGRMELLSYTKSWVHLDTRNWGMRQRFKP
jgi:hypothetical protein